MTASDSDDPRPRFHGPTSRRAALRGLAALASAGAALRTGELWGKPIPAEPTAKPVSHVHIIDGIDPSTEFRPEVIRRVNAGETTLARGSHDFWMCFPIPAQPAGNPTSPNFSFSMLETPRPLRGIADMRQIPPGLPDLGVAASTVWTLLHELSHHWLCPNDIGIRVGGETVSPMPYHQQEENLLADRRLRAPALVARQNAHWSAFVQADESVMDGIGWDRSASDGGQWHWRARPLAVRDVTTPDGTIRFAGRANDLELMLMGAKQPGDCYPSTKGDFHWMEPTLMVGPPMGYFAGIYVSFDADDTLYFGFAGDHRTLAVGRPGMPSMTPVEIPGYRPLRNESEAMMLRIVRRGSRWLCQARRGNSASSIVAAAVGGRGAMMFDGIETAGSAPTTGNFDDFRTVAVVDIARTPRTIGTMVKTWNSVLAESQVFTFEVHDGGSPTFFAAASAVESTSDAVPAAGTLVRSVPRAGAWIRRRNSSLKLGVPFVGEPYDHWIGVDKAPKLVMRAPTGDFAFGSSLKVSRAFVSPGAGGAALGCEVWGRQHHANVRDVVIPERLRRSWVAPPASFRTAFIIVTPSRKLLTSEAIANVELLRRFFDAAMRDYSGGLLLSDSRM